MNKTPCLHRQPVASRTTSGRIAIRFAFLMMAVAGPLLTGCYSPGQRGFFDEFQINPPITRRPVAEGPEATGEYRYEATPAIGDHHRQTSVQRAAWQESISAGPLPAPQTQLPGIDGPDQQMQELAGQPDPRDRRPPRSPDTGFVADELARSLPKSATELVIELNGQMATLRSEILELRQTVEKVRYENQELRSERDRLSERLANLERELNEARQDKLRMTSQFESLNRRIQQFNERRQRQITDLNRIIDQLENQLRAPDASRMSPATNPYRPAPSGTEKTSP